MMAESNSTPDPQGSSKPIPENVNSQRSRRNLQRTFDPSNHVVKIIHASLWLTLKKFHHIKLTRTTSLKLYVTILEKNLSLN